jgi:hypothetical protein
MVNEVSSDAILACKAKENHMLDIAYLTARELEAGLDHIRQAPKDYGTLKMIVSRPQEDEREMVEQGELSLSEGLIGDNWKRRGSQHTPDGSAHLYAQITVMNVRCIALLAQQEERWALAGDQLYVDFDLSEENIPPGTRLGIGSAILEVSAEPHSGCKKFSARFGVEAMKFVNSPEGKRLHLRGINAKVLQAGVIQVGDTIKKIDSAER